MPKRLPSSVLEASGAFTKDPQRKRVDPIATGDLGSGPSYFLPEQLVIWDELKGQLLPGLCKTADRFIFEIAVRLMHQYRTDPSMASSKIAQLMNALGRLGLSPADRTRCSVPVQETTPQDNTFNDFA